MAKKLGPFDKELNDSSTPEYKGVITADGFDVYTRRFHAPSDQQARQFWADEVSRVIGLYDYAKKVKTKFKKL